jgi:hypothetical protein
LYLNFSNTWKVDFNSKRIQKSNSGREYDEKDFVKLEVRQTEEATSKASALTTDATNGIVQSFPYIPRIPGK